MWLGRPVDRRQSRLEPGAGAGYRRRRARGQCGPRNRRDIRNLAMCLHAQIGHRSGSTLFLERDETACLSVHPLTWSQAYRRDTSAATRHARTRYSRTYPDPRTTASSHGAAVTRCAQATAHSVRAWQWMVARSSLERRLERDAAALKVYGWRIVPIWPAVLPLIDPENPSMPPPSRKSTFRARCFLTARDRLAQSRIRGQCSWRANSCYRLKRTRTPSAMSKSTVCS